MQLEKTRKEHTMEIDIRQIAAAIVATLTPYMPLLIEVGKAGGRKLAEVIAEKGGEAGWKKAQALWRELKARFGNEPEVVSAATMVATKPDDETRQTMLAEVLSNRLTENPELARELFDLLGGREAIQEVLAERTSWIEDVIQHIESTGTQTVRASNGSIIKGVRQIKR